jgi:hypothetical protein
MKAEHRKELETNSLAQGITKSAEALKAHSKLVYQIVGIVLLIGGAVAISWYFLGGVSTAQSRLWSQFDAAPDVDALVKLAEANKGTVAARAAQFEAARILFQEGFTNFGTAGKPHEEAVTKIDKARTIYNSLIPDSKSTPLLAQEALMGVARAEETLSATLRPDQAGPFGSLDRATEFYRRVVKEYPDTFQAKTAADRLKVLDDPKQKADLQTFYADLNYRLVPGAAPPKP